MMMMMMMMMMSIIGADLLYVSMYALLIEMDERLSNMYRSGNKSLKTTYYFEDTA